MNIWTCIPMMWTICISHKNNHFQVALHGIKIWTNKHIDCTLILIFNFSSNVGKWYFSPTSSYFIPLFDFLHHSLIVVKDFHWSILQYTTFELFSSLEFFFSHLYLLYHFHENFFVYIFNISCCFHHAFFILGQKNWNVSFMTKKEVIFIRVLYSYSHHYQMMKMY
jgi:hypothetical protein